MTPRGEHHNRDLREAARRRLLDAALALFAERGYGRATMAEIADRAGVSKGLAYNYFEGKEAMLETLLGELLRLTLDAWEQDEGLAPAERLRSFIGSSIERARSRPELTRLYLRMLLDADTEGPLMRAKLALLPRLERWQRELAELLEEVGAGSEPIDTLLLVSLVNGLSLTQLVSPERPDADALVARAFELVTHQSRS